MGLIQTAEQLRFSYLAIIEGSKQLCLTTSGNDTTVPFSANNNSYKSKANSPKILRSNAIIEDEINCENEICFGDIGDDIMSKNSDKLDDMCSNPLPPLPARCRRSLSTTSSQQSGSTSPEPDLKRTKSDSFSSVPQNDMISTEESANHSELTNNSNNNSNNNSVINPKTESLSQTIEQQEVRRRLREEKKRKTTETIERIKKKQKESEDRSQLKKHLIKYSLISMGFVLLFGTGIFIYSSLMRGDISVNSETIAPNVDEL